MRPDGTSPLLGRCRRRPRDSARAPAARRPPLSLPNDRPDLRRRRAARHLPWGAGDEIAWHCGMDALRRGKPSPAEPGPAAFPARRRLHPARATQPCLHRLRAGRARRAWRARPQRRACHSRPGLTGAADRRSRLLRLYGIIRGPRTRSARPPRTTRRGSTAKRSTASTGPDNLWNLHDDAKPKLRRSRSTGGGGRFEGRHSGYARLPRPVTVRRAIALADAEGRLDRARHDRRRRHAQPARSPAFCARGLAAATIGAGA